MSRETLCCVFQVLLFGMDPLFLVCQNAKIWSHCMLEPVLKGRFVHLVKYGIFSATFGLARIGFKLVLDSSQWVCVKCVGFNSVFDTPP